MASLSLSLALGGDLNLIHRFDFHGNSHYQKEEAGEREKQGQLEKNVNDNSIVKIEIFSLDHILNK